MLFESDEQKKLFGEIMQVSRGYFSVFTKIQTYLENYCNEGQRTFALQYWYVTRTMTLCEMCLSKKSSDAEEKRLVDALIPLLISEEKRIKSDTVAYLNKKNESLNATNKKLAKSVLGAFTVNTLTSIYDDDLEASVLSKKEKEVLQDFISVGEISLPDKAELFKTRLNYLMSTGYNRRGEGSTASQSIGGSAGLSVGVDFGKTVTPVGFEASCTLNVTGKLVSQKIIAVERQNDNQEDWEMRAYCLMYMVGWSGGLDVGGKVELKAGPSISANNPGMGIECASLGLGASINAEAGGKISGEYLSVDDPSPKYYLSILDIEDPLFILVNKMPENPAHKAGPNDSFLQLWSHAYEAGAGAGYKVGVEGEVGVESLEAFVGSKGNVQLKGNAKISNYRFQTITSPPKSLIKTQDTQVVLKQVAVSASIMAGAVGQYGNFTIGNTPEEARYTFINTVSSKSAIAVWEKNQTSLMPGTGYVVSLSVSVPNLTQYYVNEDESYEKAVSAALGVSQNQLNECITNDHFRERFYDISTSTYLPGAMFLEASFAYAGNEKVPLDDNGYVVNNFRRLLEESTLDSSKLESIRLCYRREDSVDNSYNRFKLGFNCGLKLGIELGKIEKAGTSEMINVYQRWYGQMEKYNNLPGKDPNESLDEYYNHAVIHPKLFL